MLTTVFDAETPLGDCDLSKIMLCIKQIQSNVTTFANYYDVGRERCSKL
jgi:hypothetical protein